jgi:hypothetical protein
MSDTYIKVHIKSANDLPKKDGVYSVQHRDNAIVYNDIPYNAGYREYWLNKVEFYFQPVESIQQNVKVETIDLKISDNVQAIIDKMVELQDELSSGKYTGIPKLYFDQYGEKERRGYILSEKQEQELKDEIQHIFDSGANEIRIFEMSKLFIKQLFSPLPSKEEVREKPKKGHIVTQENGITYWEPDSEEKELTNKIK